MRFALPSPFVELSHTADAAIEVTGASEAEAYARAALAVGQLLAGGGAVSPDHARALAPGGDDRVDRLVDLLRQVLARFYAERLILAAIDVDVAADGAMTATGWFSPWDERVHADGTDVKAATYGGAAFARDGDRWIARVIFDL